MLSRKVVTSCSRVLTSAEVNIMSVIDVTYGLLYFGLSWIVIMGYVIMGYYGIFIVGYLSGI